MTVLLALTRLPSPVFKLASLDDEFEVLLPVLASSELSDPEPEPEPDPDPDDAEEFLLLVT